MTAGLKWLAFPLMALACSASPAPGPTRTPATLELAWSEGKQLTITVRNTGTQPMLVFRPYHPALWSGWELEIRGPKGRFGFVAAPSPFVAGPDAFVLLRPGESFAKSLDLSEAVAFDVLPSAKEERALLKCPGVYHATVAYTFDLAAATKEKDSPAMARAFRQLADLDTAYQPLRPTKASAEFTVK